MGLLRVKPAAPLAAGKEATVEIVYSGKAGTTHEGLFTVTDNDDPSAPPFFFTHFEPNYAQRFFPAHDVPHDKATTELVAVVDPRYQVLSNGTKVLDETFSEGDKPLRRVHWRQEKPHPIYAVALAVGVFDTVPVLSDVPAAIHVPKGKASRAVIAANATQGALTFFETYLGVKYPWAKHDQVAVPRFFWGGMENTSLVLNRENGLVLEHPNHIAGQSRIVGLVAHEMAHQWFGNLVTCRTWSDLWLNEGFATFLGALAEDHYFDNDYVEVDRAADTFVSYFRTEDGPRSRPLVGGAVGTEDGFDNVAYVKGAHVLRMLELWVGQDAFRKGLKAYLEKHAHGSARSEDFFAAMGAATGQSKALAGFQSAWLRKRGYPVLTPEWKWSGGKLTLTVRQRPNHKTERGPFVFKLPVVVHRDTEPKYAREVLLTVDRETVSTTVELPGAPEWINWNKDGVALARVEPKAISEQQWIQAARRDPDPVWRLLANLTLLGELVNPDAKELVTPSDAAMGALLDTLALDPSPYVRAAVLHRLGDTQWKRLPSSLGPVVLALARRPTDLPEDAFGRVRVRSAAMAALGKIDSPEGHQYLLAELAKKDVDLNFLPALATGTARIGSNAAVATLGMAINQQKSRGYVFHKAAAGALGAVENPEVIGRIRDLLDSAAGNNELANLVIYRLWDNHTVKSSPAGIDWVRGFVLDNRDFGDDMKSRVLKLLDEVKTPEAQTALLAVAEKAESARLRASAKHVLERNFPKQPAKAATR